MSGGSGKGVRLGVWGDTFKLSIVTGVLLLGPWFPVRDPEGLLMWQGCLGAASLPSQPPPQDRSTPGLSSWNLCDGQKHLRKAERRRGNWERGRCRVVRSPERGAGLEHREAPGPPGSRGWGEAVVRPTWNQLQTPSLTSSVNSGQFLYVSELPRKWGPASCSARYVRRVGLLGKAPGSLARAKRCRWC